MKFYVICPVRRATQEQQEAIMRYIALLESEGHTVFYPPRDNVYEQSPTGMDICRANRNAIERADIVLVYYDPTSLGSHFDLGIAFALHKPVVLINDPPDPGGKAFSRVIRIWAATGAE